MSTRARDISPPSFSVTPIKPTVGAQVRGLDLTQPVDEPTRLALYEAAVEHVALVIRDQHLTPAQFAAAAALFGELMPDQVKTALVEGVPMVSILDNFEKDSQGNQAKVPKNVPGTPTIPTKSARPSSRFSTPRPYPGKGAAPRSST